jgi:hypothetical protein
MNVSHLGRCNSDLEPLSQALATLVHSYLGGPIGQDGLQGFREKN